MIQKYYQLINREIFTDQIKIQTFEMIPLIKVVSLLFRVFSKPLINYTKMYHATNQIKSNRLKVFFIMMGNKYHKFENYVNKRYLKVASDFAYKPLNDNLALQKGIQFFYQLVFYCIVIGFPVYQLYIASEQSKQKSTHLNQRLKNIEQKSIQVKQKIQQLIVLKKSDQKVEESLLQYNLKNIAQLKFNQTFKFCVESPIKLYYGQNLIKQYKYCLVV